MEEENREQISYEETLIEHRDKLRKLCGFYRDWDYQFLNNFVFAIIENMYEYYTRGNNIHQTDESLEVIKNSLKEVLDKIEKFKKASKVFFPERNEDELLEDIYTTIGKNIGYWWD